MKAITPWHAEMFVIAKPWPGIKKTSISPEHLSSQMESDVFYLNRKHSIVTFDMCLTFRCVRCKDRWWPWPRAFHQCKFLWWRTVEGFECLARCVASGTPSPALVARRGDKATQRCLVLRSDWSSSCRKSQLGMFRSMLRMATSLSIVIINITPEPCHHISHAKKCIR